MSGPFRNVVIKTNHPERHNDTESFQLSDDGKWMTSPVIYLKCNLEIIGSLIIPFQPGSYRPETDVDM
ncbi:MAG: hypothetical protein V1846_00140 [Candidatus Komeilibacteria bacterium]